MCLQSSQPTNLERDFRRMHVGRTAHQPGAGAQAPSVAGQLSRAREVDPAGVGVEGEHLSLRGALELDQGVVGDQCGQPGLGGGATVVAQRPIP